MDDLGVCDIGRSGDLEAAAGRFRVLLEDDSRIAPADDVGARQEG